MKKRIISSIIAASMVCGIGFNVLATPLTDSQQQELQENQQKFNEINDQIRQIEDKIDALTDKIEPIVEQIDENNLEIERTKVEIAEVQVEIEQALNDIEDKQEILGGRLRATYKSGIQNNYLSVLLSAENVSDLIGKMQTINKVMNIDRELIAELDAKKQLLDEKVSSLEEKNESLDNLNKENQVKLDELNVMKDEQQGFIDEMKVEKQKVVAYLAPLERELIKEHIAKINSSSSVDELNNAINSLRGLRNQIETPEVDQEIVNAIETGKQLVSQKQAEQEAANNPNRGDEVQASGDAAAIIAYAHQFIGKPYIFGATGPDAFDCSGFTQYVFRKFGYNITRTTYTQVNQGTHVPQSQLQPGDLVFTRGTVSRPEHVGIYIGNGKMIHASRPGVGVVVGSMYNYVTARRVL